MRRAETQPAARRPDGQRCRAGTSFLLPLAISAAGALKGETAA
jgi:hypothetical protein